MAPPPPRLPHHLGALLCDHFTPSLSGIPPVSRNVGGSRVGSPRAKIPFSRISRRTGSVRRQERGLCLWQEQGTVRLGHRCSLSRPAGRTQVPFHQFPTSPLPDSVLWTARRQTSGDPTSARIGAPAVVMDPTEQLRIQAFLWVTGRCCSALHPLTQLWVQGVPGDP